MVTPKRKWVQNRKSTLSVRLSDDFRDIIDILIEEGKYFNYTDATRSALRLLFEQEKDIINARRNKVLQKPQGGGGNVNASYLRLSRRGATHS